MLKDTLWPESQEFHKSLRAHLEAVTARVIAEAISRDTSDVEVRSGRDGVVDENEFWA